MWLVKPGLANSARSPFVGRHEVGPLRVAADPGHGLGTQDRCGGPIYGGGDAGVPAGEVAVVAAAQFGAEFVAVTLLVTAGIHREDLGLILWWCLVVRMCVGKLTEVAADCDLAGMREVLSAEEYYLVPVQRGLEVRDFFAGQRLRDVGTADVGADIPGDRPYLYRGALRLFYRGHC